MIKNIKLSDLEKDKILNKSFFTTKLDNVNESCVYFKGNFFLDSYNYYPISEEYKSFDELFLRLNKNSVSHYHTDYFYKKLKSNLSNLKVFNDCCVIGSNPSNNYYSNLMHFLPRIFFETEKQIKIIVHRSLSKKFQSFIEYLFSFKKIKLTYAYLDDDFYGFKNSKIPQFLSTYSSINLLKSIKEIIPKKKTGFDKIYVRREDADYRTILNEADLIEKLKLNGFKVISTSQYEILDQISIFMNAKVILSAYGSGLANIVFCKEFTKVFEISPKIENKQDEFLSKRYENLSKLCNLQYHRFFADSVDVNLYSRVAKKFINAEVLNQSNFYKNLILKLSEVDEIIRITQQPTDE